MWTRANIRNIVFVLTKGQWCGGFIFYSLHKLSIISKDGVIHNFIFKWKSKYIYVKQLSSIVTKNVFQHPSISPVAGDLRRHVAHVTSLQWLTRTTSVIDVCTIFHAMMTSSNGNIFRVTGHLCGEFTGPRWIPHTKASDAGLWCLLWSAPE